MDTDPPIIRPPRTTDRRAIRRDPKASPARWRDRIAHHETLRPPGSAQPGAVDSDHPDPAAMAAGSGDRSRTVDDSRRLQSGVERDPRQALSRARYPLIGGVSVAAESTRGVARPLTFPSAAMGSPRPAESRDRYPSVLRVATYLFEPWRVHSGDAFLLVHALIVADLAE
jgi:hypothetical protein